MSAREVTLAQPLRCNHAILGILGGVIACHELQRLTTKYESSNRGPRCSQFLKDSLGDCFEELHHIGGGVVLPPGAFTSGCNGFVGSQRTIVELLFPCAVSEYTTI